MQIKSKKRVENYGEVFTAEREVNAMLELVKSETERIDSRFLEPACGTGNFLAEILHRKLSVVRSYYAKSQIEYDRYAILAVSSIYGIDILEDNVHSCHSRLYKIFMDFYVDTYKYIPNDEIARIAHFLLEKNIIWGDALTLKRVDDQDIIFSEWSSVNDFMMKRRDFRFGELINAFPPSEKEEKNLFSDQGEKAYIPTPIKEYEVTHYLRIADV
jgi:hypothetical protein